MAVVNATDEQKRAFTTALLAAMEARGMGYADLLPATESDSRDSGMALARKWGRGATEPNRPTVIKLEELFEMEPGTLSRHLGWLPVNARPAPDLESAILADERLDEDQKVLLLKMVAQLLRDESTQG